MQFAVVVHLLSNNKQYCTFVKPGERGQIQLPPKGMLLAYHEHNVFIIVSNYGNLKNIQNGRKSNKTNSRIETKFEFIFYFVSKGYLYVFRIHAILQMVMMMMMLETSNSFDFVVWSFFGGKHPLISLLMPYYSLLINLCNEE